VVSGSPTEAQVYREPFFSLRRPSRSVVSRFLSHLLIRLMIVSALPGQWQATAALFPVSMLWPLVAPQERAIEPGDAAPGPETRVRGLEQKNASGAGDQASQAAATRRGYELGYDGNAVERTVFTGYLWDKETNLFFAKARFYDPEVGRFISQDSYLGQVDDPPSLHRYFYANDNPTRYIDLTGHAGFKATGTDTTTVTVDEAGNVYVGGVRATESVTVEGSVDRVQAIGKDVTAATALPNRLANDAGHFVVNTVTAGGAGGVERAIREGRANVDDPASLARAYTEGNASFLTVGAVDAYVDARAGEGKGVLASTARAGGAAVVNALPVQEVTTFADPNASGYDKLEAVGTGAVKVFALGTLGKGIAKVIEEGRSAGKAKAVPVTGMSPPASTTQVKAAASAPSTGVGTAANPKRIVVDVEAHPGSVKHLEDTGVLGQPRQVNRAGARANRADALRGKEKVPGMDLDEAPPAFLRKPGEPASVRPLLPCDNRGCGASMGNQARDVPEDGWVVIVPKEEP